MNVLGEEQLNIWKGVCKQHTTLRPQPWVGTLLMSTSSQQSLLNSVHTISLYYMTSTVVMAGREQMGGMQGIKVLGTVAVLLNDALKERHFWVLYLPICLILMFSLQNDIKI